MGKKRIAICLYGQTRTFKSLEQTYRQLASNLFDFDFFVSTWDDFRDKTPFDFFTSKEFIDPQILTFTNNTDRAAYTIHRVNHLKSQYELQNSFTYDYIMLARGEILFEQHVLTKFFEEELNTLSNRTIATLSPLKTDPEGVPYLSADYTFFLTSAGFDLYSTGWKMHLMSKTKTFVTGKHGGHSFHADNILTNNLENKIVKIPHQFLFTKLVKREVE